MKQISRFFSFLKDPTFRHSLLVSAVFMGIYFGWLNDFGWILLWVVAGFATAEFLAGKRGAWSILEVALLDFISLALIASGMKVVEEFSNNVGGVLFGRIPDWIWEAFRFAYQVEVLVLALAFVFLVPYGAMKLQQRVVTPLLNYFIAWIMR
jgi:hypothetical protein